MELVDTSVWVQRRNARIAPWFDLGAERNEIALCDQIVLELLVYRIRADDYDRLARDLMSFPLVRMTDADWTRARDVQRLLAHERRGQHKGVTIADLLIAAAAERAGLTLVHYDGDFDTIRGVTGQPMRWVAERGSL
jgi:predicted nucleic acid-binding protein